jgi:hypothetical protein
MMMLYAREDDPDLAHLSRYPNRSIEVDSVDMNLKVREMPVAALLSCLKHFPEEIRVVRGGLRRDVISVIALKRRIRLYLTRRTEAHETLRIPKMFRQTGGTRSIYETSLHHHFRVCHSLSGSLCSLLFFPYPFFSTEACFQ